MTTLIQVCILLILASTLLPLMSVIKGRFSTRKLVGFDMISVSVFALLLLFIALWEDDIFVDFALFFSLFGFIATLFLSFLNVRSVASPHQKETRHDS